VQQWSLIAVVLWHENGATVFFGHFGGGVRDSASVVAQRPKIVVKAIKPIMKQMK
jgi:hypothetical protein